MAGYQNGSHLWSYKLSNQDYDLALVGFCDGDCHMTFIPQALADPASRSILHVWHNEENFLRFWADKVKTIDAPGVQTHPRLIKIGDVIDYYPTGWNKAKVEAIAFTPDSSDIPGWYRSGVFRFTVGGSFLNVRCSGCVAHETPIYLFL